MTRPQFVDRDHELEIIDRLITPEYAWGGWELLCIEGAPGVGKTRLLQEIEERYPAQGYPKLLVPDIIDFDEVELASAIQLRDRIIRSVDPAGFVDYQALVNDWVRARQEQFSSSTQEILRHQIDDQFVERFNRVSSKRRIVLRFDTTDALGKTIFWRHVEIYLPQLQNAVAIFAGRNAFQLSRNFEPALQSRVHEILLKPLAIDSAIEYLRLKEERVHFALSADLREKLARLLGGYPILLDLAVESAMRAQLPHWLTDRSLADLRSVSPGEIERRRADLQERLVTQFASFRAARDRLITILAIIQPVEEEAVGGLLHVPTGEAAELVEELKDLMFVKSLPGHRIKLHDHVQELVDQVVWPIEERRGRSRSSVRMALLPYLEAKIESARAELSEIQEPIERTGPSRLEVSTAQLVVKREQLERYVLGDLEPRRLQHLAHIDVSKAFLDLKRLLGEVDRFYSPVFRENLIRAIEPVRLKLSLSQQLELDIERCDTSIRIGSYEEAVRIADNDLIPRAKLYPEILVEAWRLKGNALVRLGKVHEGREAFEKAVEISREEGMVEPFVRSAEALGWACRLMSDWGKARDYYLEALMSNAEYGDETREASLLTSLAFVQSYLSREGADRLCWQAIEKWRKLNDKHGLGRAYMVEGTLHYHSGQYEKTILSFRKALDIFEPANDFEWISVVLSWRGATQWARAMEDRTAGLIDKATDDLKSAEQDLKDSLKTGLLRDRAMTLNRLARVYWDQDRVDDVERLLNESYETAQMTRDALYELASLRDLTRLAVLRQDFHRFDEFEQKLNEFTERWGKVLDFTTGGMKLYLGCLALGSTDVVSVQAIPYLEEGLELVSTIRNYGPRNLGYYIGDLENIMLTIVKPEITREVGKYLMAFWQRRPELWNAHPEAIVSFTKWMRHTG